MKPEYFHVISSDCEIYGIKMKEIEKQFRWKGLRRLILDELTVI
jgi:hypothetical protein